MQEVLADLVAAFMAVDSGADIRGEKRRRTYAILRLLPQDPQAAGPDTLGDKYGYILKVI
jgi:hypothetical protein